ncbi:fungal specific transcription factor domain-containing protein [Candidatus Bathyarchaeota archaeon]|nr:fungal specific transcription factor domain-containing protein [Candidatus Bathyarchaeota archaeon]
MDETVQHIEQPSRSQRALAGHVEDADDHHLVREHVRIPSPVSIGVHNLQPPDSRHDITTAQSSRNSPEPAQTDRQGHYVGPASGASFLLRVQSKLGQQPSASSSDTSIFTFGDLPFPEFDSRFLILPPRSEAESLVSRYYEFASATHRYTHRPTVEMWLQELYEPNGAMREQAAATSKTALLFMVFASAENFPKSRAGKVDPTSRLVRP